MSIWLIILGVGQRRYRVWAAGQSVGWGVIALVILIGVVVVHLTVIGPAAGRMIAAITRHSDVPSSLGSFMTLAGLGGVIFYAPYPIILIVALRKPAIAGAMRA
jgi:hypothetical protein